MFIKINNVKIMKRTPEEKKFYYTMPGLYQKKIEELERVEERVCWLFKRYPNLRNSDKLLIFYYWVLVDGYDGSLEESVITALTSSETIRRVRQHIQNDLSLFLPFDSEVIESRKIGEEAVRDWAVFKKIMKDKEIDVE